MRVWLRTWSTGVQTILLLASGLVFLLSRSEWTTELDWALNWALGTTILMGPAAAGLAAWSVTRDFPRSMQRLSWTLQRGRWYPVHLVLRTWVCSVVAWIGCVLIAAAGALTEGSSRVSLNALALLDGPAVLAACTALGACVATIFRSVAAAPVSAGTVYIVALTSSRTWTSRVLWDGGATQPLWSLAPNPSVLLGSITVNVAVAVALVALTVLLATPRTAWPIHRVMTAVISTVVAALALVLPAGQTYYTLATSQQECSTSAPVVCFADGGALTEQAVEALHAADSTLRDAGFSDLPTRYTEIPDPPATLILQSPSGEAVLTPGEVAQTIATLPTGCEVQPRDRERVGLAIRTLRDWLGVLLGDQDAQEVTPDERAALEEWAPSALHRLRACDPARVHEPPVDIA